MSQISVISFTVFLSVLLYVTAVRNALEVTFTDIRKMELKKQLLYFFWDICIIAGHAVSGAVVADMIFQLTIMSQYREYTVLGTIFIGLSFRGLLPVLVDTFQKRVTKKVNNIG